MFLQSRPPGANEFFVNGVTGSDLPANGTALKPWKTIKYAVTIANRSGDIINVLPGIYGDDNLPFQVPAGVKVAGYSTDRKNVIIAAASNFPSLIILSRNSTLEGLTVIRAPLTGVASNLLTTAGQSVDINNCIIDTNYVSDVASPTTVEAISVTQFNCAVRNCLIYSSRTYNPMTAGPRAMNVGLWVSSSNGFRLTGNELRNLMLGIATNSWVTGVCEINKNTFIDCIGGFLAHAHWGAVTYNVKDNIFALPITSGWASHSYDVRSELLSGATPRMVTINYSHNCYYNLEHSIDPNSGYFLDDGTNIKAYPWFVRPMNKDFRLYVDESPCFGTASDNGNRGAYEGGVRPTEMMITISPLTTEVAPGNQFDRFSARGEDVDGYLIPEVAVTWTVTDPAAGAIDAGSGVFTAGTTLGIFPGAIKALFSGKNREFTAYASVNVGGVGAVAGLITDESSGRAVVDALVSLEAQSARTDTVGYYAVNGVPAGTYLAQVKAGNYLDASKPVTVEAGRTTTLNFLLTRSDVPWGTVPLNIARQGTGLMISWDKALYPNPQLFVLAGDGSGQFTNNIDNNNWLPLTDYAAAHDGEIDDAAGLGDGRIVHGGQVGSGAPELYYKGVKAEISAADLPMILPTAWAVGKINAALQGTADPAGKNLIALPFQSQQGMTVAGVLGEGSETVWTEGDLVQSKFAASPAYKTAVYVGGAWKDAANTANAPAFELDPRFGNWLITKANKTATLIGEVLHDSPTVAVDVYGGAGLTTGGKTLLGLVYPQALGLTATTLINDGARAGDLIQFKVSPLNPAYISAVVSEGAWKNAANPSEPLDPRISLLRTPNSYIYVRFGDGTDAGFKWLRTKP